MYQCDRDVRVRVSPVDMNNLLLSLSCKYSCHSTICCLSEAMRVPLGTCLPHSFHHFLHQLVLWCVISSASISAQHIHVRVTGQGQVQNQGLGSLGLPLRREVLRGERYWGASSHRSGKMLFSLSCRRALRSSFLLYWLDEPFWSPKGPTITFIIHLYSPAQLCIQSTMFIPSLVVWCKV